MIIDSTIQISLKHIKKWISECNSLHNLQSIRSKTNKRLRALIQSKEESPFRNIPIEKKREALKDLFVESVSSEPRKEDKKVGGT